MCISDVCACNTKNRKNCACKALSLYARACHVAMGKAKRDNQGWALENWREGICGKLSYA